MTSLLGFLEPIDLFTIAVSLCLFIAATPICRWLNDDDGLLTRISMMRVLNFLIILAVIVNAFLSNDNIWLVKATQCLIVIYFTVLLTQIVNFFIRRRFGRVHQTKNKLTISDTYSSRGLSLIVATLLAVIAIISCLRLLGLNSLLEAGGALGVIGLVLAMTQASWAPDIISGLIILNSRFCEDGDIIEFNLDGKKTVASIFKTKLFHTECLDLANNHRVMIRNAKLRDCGIQSLSRFASARGLRECLLFNIDYKHSQQEVTAMINRAFEKVDELESTREEQHEAEVLVNETGDYAVTWAVYYYIKDVKRLLKIRQIIRSYILAESIKANISLATPSLQQNLVSLEKSNPAQDTHRRNNSLERSSPERIKENSLEQSSPEPLNENSPERIDSLERSSPEPKDSKTPATS